MELFFTLQVSTAPQVYLGLYEVQLSHICMSFVKKYFPILISKHFLRHIFLDELKRRWGGEYNDINCNQI